MKTWKQVHREIYNSRHIGLPVLTAEIIEIFEEISSADFKAAWVEVTQCWYYVQLLVHQWTGLDWYPRGVSAVLEDFYGRLDVWKEIFKKEGLEFNVDYLVGGSNYNRPAKVEAALALAKALQVSPT